MSTTDILDIATGNETIAGANLQASIDTLLAMAKSLGNEIANAPDVEAVQAIGRAQAGLTGAAMELVTAQIKLMAGEARVTADHVNAAAKAAQDAVATMTDWKKKVAVAGKLADFFGAVLTGNGAKIVETAFKLKDAL